MTPLEKIKKQVHMSHELQKYESTVVRDETNCYSYAIGATYPELKNYRIGALSQKKSIYEKYTSKEEILRLLEQDLNILELRHEICRNLKQVASGEYAIRLYIRKYANGQIADYHFIRYDPEEGWSEKWKGQMPSKVTEDYYEGRWDWENILTLKITP